MQSMLKRKSWTDYDCRARIALRVEPEGKQMIFVFEVHVKPGSRAEDYADAWVRASEIIQRAPGARGTRLHRRIGDPDVLLAIASWSSKEARDAMEGNRPETVKNIIAEQAEFVEIRIVGEF
jgi:heme-degrading monooxygenase HmoA